MDRSDIGEEMKINPDSGKERLTSRTAAGKIEDMVAAVISEKKCLPPASSRARNEKCLRADAGNENHMRTTSAAGAFIGCGSPRADLSRCAKKRSVVAALRFVAAVKGTSSVESGCEAVEAKGNEGEGSGGSCGTGGEGGSGGEEGEVHADGKGGKRTTNGSGDGEGGGEVMEGQDAAESGVQEVKVTSFCCKCWFSRFHFL